MAIDPDNFDPVAFLADVNAQADYLNDVFATNDVALVASALGVLARAHGMTRVASSAGVQREHLYRALSDRGHPEFSTIIKVIAALGLRLAVLPAA